MSADWSKVYLTDIYEIRSGLSKPAAAFGSGYPFLTFKEVFNNYFVPDNLTQLVQSTDSERALGDVRRGDVLLTRTSETIDELGMSSVALKDYSDSTFNGFTKRLRPKVDSKYVVHPEYIGYFLRSKPFRRDVLALSSMSTRASLNNEMIGRLQIVLPPPSIQESIAKVLKSLDDKIAINRRINQTLEAMAQAIFKSWFVDFDPVKAKIAAIAEGRDPLRAAMSAISGKAEDELDALPPEQYEQLAATAALFPDEMVESELGEIPRGWTPAALSTVCDLNAYTWSAKTLPASVKYVDLSNAKNGEIIEAQTIRLPDIPSRARRILNDGDTIVGTVRPGNRSFAIIGEAGLTGSTGFAALSPQKNYLREYVYLAATDDANIDRLTHLADGGAYPAVRPELVASNALPIPAESLLCDFHRISSPIFNQILVTRRTNQELADFRDTLLPKLLSGELSVEALAASAGVAG